MNAKPLNLGCTKDGVRSEATKLIDAFVKLIRHEDSVNILVNLSNQNLDMLFDKLRLMLKSQYFDDSLIIRELLTSMVGQEEKRKIPVWLVYSLLLGNYCGTFRTQDDIVRCGLVNIFSSKPPSDRPFRHFIRLHILTYCYGDGSNGDKEEYYSVREMYKSYCRLFADDAFFTETFFKSMFRLLQANLLFSKEYQSYGSPEVAEKLLLDDEIALSSSGKFYISTLIHRIDYLFFVKDDVNWIGEPDFEHADKSTDRIRKWRYTLRALRLLMGYEYQMLQQIVRNEIENIQKAGKPLIKPIYTTEFSPYRINSKTETVCFTRCIFRAFKDYIFSREGEENAENIFKKELESIRKLIKEHEDIENDFLPQ
jgi:hypothetical protein